jgi:hypothetical protein
MALISMIIPIRWRCRFRWITLLKRVPIRKARPATEHRKPLKYKIIYRTSES